jgi:hypothetical protein
VSVWNSDILNPFSEVGLGLPSVAVRTDTYIHSGRVLVFFVCLLIRMLKTRLAVILYPIGVEQYAGTQMDMIAGRLDFIGDRTLTAAI